MSTSRTIYAEVYNQQGVAISEIECEALFEVDETDSEVSISEIFVVWDGKRITLVDGDPGYEAAYNAADRMLQSADTRSMIEEDLFEEVREYDYPLGGLSSGQSAWLSSYAAE